MTNELAREIATDIILDSVRDFEYSDIGEIMSDREDTEALTDDEFDALQNKVSDLIASADLTVGWSEW